MVPASALDLKTSVRGDLRPKIILVPKKIRPKHQMFVGWVVWCGGFKSAVNEKMDS